MKLVVYGTLRDGEYNNHLLPEGEYETVSLNGFRLYNLGPFPGAKFGEKHDRMVVEIWEFRLEPKDERRLIRTLDMLEGVREDGCGLYRRELIETPNGEAWIYIFNGKVAESSRIVDWCKKETLHRRG